MNKIYGLARPCPAGPVLILLTLAVPGRFVSDLAGQDGSWVNQALGCLFGRGHPLGDVGGGGTFGSRLQYPAAGHINETQIHANHGADDLIGAKDHLVGPHNAADTQACPFIGQA